MSTPRTKSSSVNPTTQPQSLIGHESLRERFRNAWERGRLASAFLFVGEPGIGKRRFAEWLAAGILCGGPEFRGEMTRREDVSEERPLDPCTVCRSCKMLAAGSHPDLHVITKPEDKTDIPVELLIGDREHRMREGLLSDISLKPAVGRRKVAIIDDADSLNEAGANCLLKTLEEPPPGTVLILVGSSEHRQLPTIRSRCQIIRFDRLSIDEVAQVFNRMELEVEEQTLSQAIQLSQGSVQIALDWLDTDLHAFREQLQQHLAGGDPTNNDFAKTMLQFVESGGTEARKRRRRLERVIDLTIEHYRGLMKEQARIATTSGMSPRRAADAIQVCMAAQSALHSNAHLPTLIDGWLIELGQVLRGETLLGDSFARL